MVSEKTIEKCRKKLEQLARSGDRLTYGELMRYLGIGRQSIKDCLNPIYKELMQAKRPDLTLIVHYTGSRFGLYNSRGAEAQSMRVDADNQDQVRAYKDDLRNVYQVWGGQPKGDLKEWLDS